MMQTRRHFVAQAIAGTLGASSATQVLAKYALQSPKARKGADAYRHIKVLRRDDKIVRHKINGDIFPLTWTRDDRQFSVFSDGFGWSAAPTRFYNSRALWIEGDPIRAAIYETDAYPDPPPQSACNPPYYGFGALAVDDRIYQLMCCLGKASETRSGRPWNGVKLIYSSDQGRTWCNQNGSTPVVWESYAEQSLENMLFLDEPQESFGLISLLQMGRNYEANRDGYVYGYATNGNTDGTMNQLVMFRVRKRSMLDRTAYEFFGGMLSSGEPTWERDIQNRKIVQSFPRGWVNDQRQIPNLVQTWVPSVVYNAAHGTYLMVASGIGVGQDGEWDRPSYLGFWIAPNPWGPWTQIHEDKAWAPGNDTAARCYSPQIAPKWMAPDGSSFWLVWSDFQGATEYVAELKRRNKEIEAMIPSEQLRIRAQMFRSHAPYYSFNVQRVDFTIS
ncbi:DUF4185 domain-containing protein [Steroidobacter sp. S1-65]|uniref:DUF4185 domain-containing protein n=1 Tax=Steroidobacter gossypii TaxID=2805490 RepID=A0ABS1X6S2_9GAMM|nr:DUF4185 domain-containing protein [Steroidobacter gossypii]MBM0108923.1 DUF4185 domain-containing protein [Steroidobacter gossypii]